MLRDRSVLQATCSDLVIKVLLDDESCKCNA